MTELQPGDIEKRKGVWSGCLGARSGLFVRKALISCPGCGKLASLLKHDIADDGVVDPSMNCPNDACDFHDYVTLLDWKPYPKEEA